jgi:hypothetical protein
MLLLSQSSHTVGIVLGSLVAESVLPPSQGDEAEEVERSTTTKVLEVKDLYMYICPEEGEIKSKVKGDGDAHLALSVVRSLFDSSAPSLPPSLSVCMYVYIHACMRACMHVCGCPSALLLRNVAQQHVNKRAHTHAHISTGNCVFTQKKKTFSWSP